MANNQPAYDPTDPRYFDITDLRAEVEIRRAFEGELGER